MLKGLTISVKARPGTGPIHNGSRSQRGRRGRAAQAQAVDLVDFAVAQGGKVPPVQARPAGLEKHYGKLYKGRPGEHAVKLLSQQREPLPGPAEDQHPPNTLVLKPAAGDAVVDKPQSLLQLRMPGVHMLSATTSPESPALPSPSRQYSLEHADLRELSFDDEIFTATTRASDSHAPLSPKSVVAPTATTALTPRNTQETLESAPDPVILEETTETRPLHSDKEGYVDTIATQLTEAMRLNLEKSERNRLKALKREKEIASLQLGSKSMKPMPRELKFDNRAASPGRANTDLGAIMEPGFGNGTSSTTSPSPSASRSASPVTVPITISLPTTSSDIDSSEMTRSPKKSRSRALLSLHEQGFEDSGDEGGGIQEGDERDEDDNEDMDEEVADRSQVVQSITYQSADTHLLVVAAEAAAEAEEAKGAGEVIIRDAPVDGHQLPLSMKGQLSSPVLETPAVVLVVEAVNDEGRLSFLEPNSHGPIPTVTFESVQRPVLMQRTERPTSAPTIAPKDPLTLPPPGLELSGSPTGQLSPLRASTPQGRTILLSQSASRASSPLAGVNRPVTPAVASPVVEEPTPASAPSQRQDLTVVLRESKDALSMGGMESLESATTGGESMRLLQLTERSLLLTERTTVTERDYLDNSPDKMVVIRSLTSVSRPGSPDLLLAATALNTALNSTSSAAAAAAAARNLHLSTSSPRAVYPVAPVPLQLFPDGATGGLHPSPNQALPSGATTMTTTLLTDTSLLPSIAANAWGGGGGGGGQGLTTMPMPQLQNSQGNSDAYYSNYRSYGHPRESFVSLADSLDADVEGGDHRLQNGATPQGVMGGELAGLFYLDGGMWDSADADRQQAHTKVAGAGFRAVAPGRGPVLPSRPALSLIAAANHVPAAMYNDEAEGERGEERRPLHFPVVRRPLPLKTVPPPKLLNIAITRHARVVSARKRKEEDRLREQEREARKRLHLFAALYMGRDDLPIDGIGFDDAANDSDKWELERRVAEDGHVVYSPRIGAEAVHNQAPPRDKGGRWSSEGSRQKRAPAGPRPRGVVYIPRDDDDASLQSINSLAAGNMYYGGHDYSEGVEGLHGPGLHGDSEGEGRFHFEGSDDRGQETGLYSSAERQMAHTRLARRVDEQLRRFNDIKRWGELSRGPMAATAGVTYHVNSDPIDGAPESRFEYERPEGEELRFFNDGVARNGDEHEQDYDNYASSLAEAEAEADAEETRGVEDQYPRGIEWTRWAGLRQEAHENSPAYRGIEPPVVPMLSLPSTVTAAAAAAAAASAVAAAVGENLGTCEGSEVVEGSSVRSGSVAKVTVVLPHVNAPAKIGTSRTFTVERLEGDHTDDARRTGRKEEQSNNEPILSSRAMPLSSRPRSANVMRPAVRPRSGTAHRPVSTIVPRTAPRESTFTDTTPTTEARDRGVERTAATEQPASMPSLAFPALPIAYPPTVVVNALPRGKKLAANSRVDPFLNDLAPHPMDTHPHSVRWKQRRQPNRAITSAHPHPQTGPVSSSEMGVGCALGSITTGTNGWSYLNPSLPGMQNHNAEMLLEGNQSSDYDRRTAQPARVVFDDSVGYESKTTFGASSSLEARIEGVNFHQFGAGLDSSLKGSISTLPGIGAPSLTALVPGGTSNIVSMPTFSPAKNKTINVGRR